MKVTQTLLVAVALSVGLLSASGAAQAALIDRGGGLIYDTDLNITWLKDANYAKTSGYDADGLMTWSKANTWATNLSYFDSVRNQTLVGWRLPTTLELDPTCGAQHGDYSSGGNCTGSEMGHLFYNELGGLAGQSISTTHSANYTLFQNVQSGVYWSSTVHAPNTNDKIDFLNRNDPTLSLNYAWLFNFNNGSQIYDYQASSYSALAVRQGDVATPILLSPGESATIHFAFTAPPQSGVDYIRLGAAAHGSSAGPSQPSQVDIFNGNSLLGTYQGSFSNLNYLGQWTAPGSFFSASLPLIDFTAIRNGSINGKMILKNTSTTGGVQFDPANLEVVVSTAVGAFATSTDWTKQPVITSVVKNSNSVPPPPAFVPPVVLQTPVAPISAVPPFLLASQPPSTAKKIVIVTHGWNGSAVDPWVVSLVKNICFKIGATNTHEDTSGTKPVWACSTPGWIVSSADWSDEANGPLLFYSAYVHAGTLGDSLGDAMAKIGFEHIHFIAHSAGSNLIQHATRRIKDLCAGTGSTYCATTEIHQTFLDAYAPLLQAQPYGDGADYAEQFVDTLPVGSYGIPDATKIMLPHVFNYDITALDPFLPDLIYSVLHHGWPYDFYNASVTPPILEPVFLAPGSTPPYKYGFPISTEGGGVSASLSYPPLNCSCKITDAQNSVCEVGAPNSKAHCPLPPFIFPALVNAFTHLQSAIGPTGKANFSWTIGSSSPMPTVVLTTGSPAWISVQFQAGEPVDILDFDYAFSSSAQGLLSVFLDNDLIFRSEELHSLPGINASGPLPFKVDSTVPHVLSFRLDPMSDVQSVVEISNIRPSSVQISTITNRPPIANAGPNRTLRATSPTGTSTMLDGSGSSDPDMDSLTFTWAGPFGTVTGPKPTVTLPLGTNTINLTVHDGSDGTATSTVSIMIPILGDIDEDGDVDLNDLKYITAALNKPASGPNDLRDLDGDGMITALDARKLTLLCTRPRCAVQ